MSLKAVLGRGIPAGAAAALLFSSASPLKPALEAFSSAGNVLGGAEHVDTSGITMPDEASVQAALGGAGGAALGGSGGFSVSKLFQSLFGPSKSDVAKAQLATIIENVKGRSQASSVPGQAPPGKAGKGPGKAGAPGKQPAGKGGQQGTKGGKPAASGKAAPSPAPTPAPAAPDPGGEPAGE